MKGFSGPVRGDCGTRPEEGVIRGSLRLALAISLVLPALLFPATLRGQDLSRRVFQVESGTVRFTYPTRQGVEICEQGIRMGERQVMWHSGGWDRQPTNCNTGSAEVEVLVRNGEVRDLEVLRRVQDRTRDAVELGTVAAPVAVEFFLGAARSGGPGGRGVEEAILPALLADVDGLWQDLLDMAQNPTVAKDVRTTALFWVGQEAADVVTRGLAEVALDEKEDQEVRDAAVFALSQRPPDESVPVLMEVARTAEHPDTRKSAMFWLAQSKDERVYAFFKEILLGSGGG